MRKSASRYLSAIFLLEQKMAKVRSIDIVHVTGYTKPSVSVAIKKLQAEGYVYINHQNEIILSEEGRKKAQEIQENCNVLIEALEIMGVSSDIAIEDAYKIEHVIHHDSLSKIKAFIQKYKK